MEKGKKIIVKFDNRIIHKISYRKKTKQWMGMYKKNIASHNTTQISNTKFDKIPLGEDWLNQNFGKKYIGNIKKKCIAKNSCQFQTVNAGAYDNKLSEIDKYNGFSNIKIQYIQAENERSCIVLSIANALRYLLYPDICNSLLQKKETYMNTPDALKVICHELSKQFQRIRRTAMHEFLKADDFDVINDKKGLYLVTLVGTDGNNDHCVAIWDNFIFDCNKQFALIRNINNLNRCCST